MGLETHILIETKVQIQVQRNWCHRASNKKKKKQLKTPHLDLCIKNLVRKQEQGEKTNVSEFFISLGPFKNLSE